MKISESLPEKIIYLITDGTVSIKNFPEKKKKLLKLFQTAVRHKISLIQIREKRIPARLQLELTAETVKIARNTNTKILVNDRADIALAAGADGVHLTSKAIPTEIIRRNYPKDFLIGVSIHLLEEAERARRQGADFVTFGPVFATPSKDLYGAPQGIEKLREVCQKSEPFPVIALGGIDRTNYRQVLENGAAGFAAIRFLNDEVNLEMLELKNY